MKDLLAFMGEHPVLTVILVFLFALMVTESFKYIAYAMSRTPPPVEKNEDDD